MAKKTRKNASRVRRYNAKIKARSQEKMYGRIFNGNVYNQWEFIFIWALILAMLAGLWMWFFIMYRPISKKMCEKKEVVIQSYDVINGEDYVKITFAANGEEYNTAYFKKLNGFDSCKPIGKDTEILLFGKEVVRLSISGVVYVDLDEVNEIRADSRSVSLIPLIMGVVWLIFAAISWYVMYNAQRFPGLVKLFVKPSYLNKDKIYKRR